MDLEAIRHVYLRRVVGTALGALGLKTTTTLARRLARGVHDLHTAGRDRAQRRLREALGQAATDPRITATTAAMYDHIGRFWAEALFARRRLRDSSWRKFVHLEDEPAWRALADARRGCVLATAYFGNPAVGAYALGQVFRPVHVIVDLLAHPQLRAWQTELHSLRWVRPIDRREALHVVPAVLREGGAVMLICEHERLRGKAIPTPFLGRRLRCYPTLGRLAWWLNVPVGVFTCRRVGDDGFSFAVGLHATVEHGGQEVDDDSVVHRSMAALERAIMACPEQYLWSMHRRAASPLGLIPDVTPTATETETESASSRRTRRTGSASQRPSTAGSRPGAPAVASAPVPTA